MPGAGLEPARPRGGHLILSRPCRSRPISVGLRFSCLRGLFALLILEGLSACLGGPRCHLNATPRRLCLGGPGDTREGGSEGLETASAYGYLRPSTRLTLLPRASLLPDLALWAITRPTRLDRARRLRPTDK